ncbi:adult-specific cuticular protein ACP-20 [Aedes aegypti]|uniref:Uncharacterized protein n=1 Tax=Aedes aegypti TaxID=7159 RepID=A0A1S4FL17_AEDAE|nr:adult-specific cuticular protein ACP-20 [Aedes aegypti]
MLKILLLIGAVLFITVEPHPAKPKTLYLTKVKHVPVEYYEDAEKVKPKSHHLGEVDSDLGSEHIDYYAYPMYKFEYGVKDMKTGDHKSQWEMRDGDVVKGSYTLDEPDGTQRIVEYRADDKHGFEAIVKTIRPLHHRQQYLAEQQQQGAEGLEGQGHHHNVGQSYSKLKKYA